MSVFVILASSSVRLSPHCDWSEESNCRPQIAAPTLPVAIMEGGYMAKLKSGRGEKEQLDGVQMFRSRKYHMLG